MTCTFLSETCTETHISVKSSKSPYACQNKRPLEWQASTVCVMSVCLRQRDGLSGAGGRPKMTWHSSQRYCLCSFFHKKAYFWRVTETALGHGAEGLGFQRGEALHISDEETTGSLHCTSALCGRPRKKGQTLSQMSVVKSSISVRQYRLSERMHFPQSHKCKNRAGVSCPSLIQICG